MPAAKEYLGAPGDDPRNNADVDAMPATLMDDPANLPGDQPVDDTPPSKTLADATMTREELDAET